LTGWGHPSERRWRRIRDHWNAAARGLDDGSRVAALVTLDIMVIDRQFTVDTRLTTQRLDRLLARPRATDARGVSVAKAP